VKSYILYFIDLITSIRVGKNLWIGLAVLILFTTVLFGFAIRYIRNQKIIIDKLRDDEVKLFQEGNPELLIETENGNRLA